MGGWGFHIMRSVCAILLLFLSGCAAPSNLASDDTSGGSLATPQIPMAAPEWKVGDRWGIETLHIAKGESKTMGTTHNHILSIECGKGPERVSVNRSRAGEQCRAQVETLSWVGSDAVSVYHADTLSRTEGSGGPFPLTPGAQGPIPNGTFRVGNLTEIETKLGRVWAVPVYFELAASRSERWYSPAVPWPVLEISTLQFSGGFNSTWRWEVSTVGDIRANEQDYRAIATRTLGEMAKANRDVTWALEDYSEGQSSKEEAVAAIDRASAEMAAIQNRLSANLPPETLGDVQRFLLQGAHEYEQAFDRFSPCFYLGVECPEGEEHLRAGQRLQARAETLLDE